MTQIQQSYKKGDIVWVDLGDVIGSEQGGTRPAVIIQNNLGNKVSPCVIVGVITSQEKKDMPTHVEVSPDYESGLYKPSTVLLEQIRTIDKKRILKRAGQIGESMIQCINKALCVSLGL